MTNFRTYDVRVAGVTFEGRQDILRELTGNEPVGLQPEPENQYDPDAVAVYVTFKGEVLKIGYVPKQIAKIIAPLLEGEAVMCRSLQITGGFQTSSGDEANFGARFVVDVQNPPE